MGIRPYFRGWGLLLLYLQMDDIPAVQMNVLTRPTDMDYHDHLL